MYVNTFPTYIEKLVKLNNTKLQIVLNQSRVCAQLINYMRGSILFLFLIYIINRYWSLFITLWNILIYCLMYLLIISLLQTLEIHQQPSSLSPTCNSNSYWVVNWYLGSLSLCLPRTFFFLIWFTFLRKKSNKVIENKVKQPRYTYKRY